MAKTDPINTANPAGTSDRRLGDDYIRTLARAVIEILQKDHYTGASSPYNEDAAGEHAKITLRQTTKPSNVADKGFLYTKDVSGTTELFYEDEAGNEKKLTVAGKLNVEATEAVLLTGDQTIAGVKTFDEGINAGAAKIVNMADPETDYHAANKKYVDETVAALTYDDKLGTWASKDIDTEYTAASDGFVLVSGVSVFDVETPTGTVRISGTNYGAYADGACCPVKKGDTWKVVVASGTPTVFWIPIGA